MENFTINLPFNYLELESIREIITSYGNTFVKFHQNILDSVNYFMYETGTALQILTLPTRNDKFSVAKLGKTISRNFSQYG